MEVHLQLIKKSLVYRMSDYTIAVKYAMFFMVTMLVEWVVQNIKEKVYNLPDTISSISSGMTNNIKSILNLSVVIISYQWMFNIFNISNCPLGGYMFWHF